MTSAPIDLSASSSSVPAALAKNKDGKGSQRTARSSVAIYVTSEDKPGPKHLLLFTLLRHHCSNKHFPGCEDDVYDK